TAPLDRYRRPHSSGGAVPYSTLPAVCKPQAGSHRALEQLEWRGGGGGPRPPFRGPRLRGGCLVRSAYLDPRTCAGEKKRGTSVSDLEKTTAIIAALTDLPGSDARRLLDDLTARISALPAKSFIRMIMTQALLRPTAALNPGAVVSLTETCARAVHDDTRDGDQLLRAVYVALFGNDALMTKARELINDAKGQ